MSYLLTDAGEADMRKEMSVLDELNEDIDQLAADARDCDTVAPKVKTLLDIAWYFSEEAIREARGAGSCGHAGTDPRQPGGGWCACCAHYEELRHKAESIGRRL